MKTRLLLLLMAVLVLSPRAVEADEGMWLPFLMDDALYAEMHEMGLELSREELFSFTGTSLKDAIVNFGGGCTAEIISDKGLLLTNHHCGYGRIQAHSSVDNDLLSEGFWAMRMEDELPNPGLFVRFLVSAEDVSGAFNEVLDDEMDEQERSRVIRQKSQELVDAATRDNHYTANVRSMFAGNEFFLFVYETYRDVRLVGTPPESIGAYGGDTDNWMWPRHTGDFALFRVYSAPDGKPADYSPENIPLVPRHHLPVSAAGVKENDFAMILGYPGSTQRYLTSFGIEYNLEMMYPVRIDIRRRKLDIIEDAMASSDAIRIIYASRQSSIANYWKNFIGMSRALQMHRVADTKREKEAAFSYWVNQDEGRRQLYGDVLPDLETVYNAYRDFHSQQFVFSEAMASGPDVLRTAWSFSRLAGMLQKDARSEETLAELERLEGSLERVFRNFDAGVDQALWAAMFAVYAEKIPAEFLPEVFADINRRYRGDFQSYARDVYRNSIFANEARLRDFLRKPSLRTLERDPAFVAARSVFNRNTEVNRQMQAWDDTRSRAERLFLRGLREMNPDGLFYPDANGTMRFTYGTVRGYHPADAVYYHYVTTLEGVMEKEDPGHHEFIVPEKLKQLHLDRDYGPWHENGRMIVNFISDNDITGGNSGSPVINGRGELIGLAFDGNWEAMSGDILFAPDVQRTISVDARYILFIIDKFAGATHLIEEMTIVH